jgi:hypothetical protein
MCKGKYQEWLTEEGKVRLQGWARDGLSDEQLAEKMGICTSTFYAWKNKYPEISEALKEGKDVADRKVENALYKRACGFEYEEVTTERDEINGKMITKRVTKFYPPDPTSMIFWLKNRKPDEWRDKRETEVSGSGGGPLTIRWMNSPDEKVDNNA